MSSGVSGGSDGSFDADDLSEIRERFKELTKEKEMLRDSKSEGFELIKRLEFHVKSLSVSRDGDKKRITDLERELSNCVQEIDDYLQDQLGERNSSLDYPSEQPCSCHFKLADMKNLEVEVGRLKEQIKISDFERSLLMQEIEDKDEAIRCSAARIGYSHLLIITFGEKLLGSLGGMFSRTWKPKKTRPITGPVITRDDQVQRKSNHLEREKLGLTSASKERTSTCTRTPLPEPTTAMQKVEVEKVKQDDALSDLSNILGELKEMAIDMGCEMDRQNKALDHVQESG